MKLSQVKPEHILWGIAAGVVLFVAINPRAAGAALVKATGDLLAGAGGAALDAAQYSAQEYGLGGQAAQSGQVIAETESANWIRSLVGLPDLNAEQTKAACAAAMAAGDDAAALKYCGPLDQWRGFWDGK